MTAPVARLVIAAATVNLPAPTNSRKTVLRESNIAAASFAFCSATACTNAASLEVCGPSSATTFATEGRILASVAVRFPSFTSSMASFIAPQSELAQNDDGFRTGHFRCELEAPDDISVNEIPGDAGGEDVADLLIEDQLRRHPTVDAPNNRREWRLPRSRSRRTWAIRSQ